MTCHNSPVVDKTGTWDLILAQSMTRIWFELEFSILDMIAQKPMNIFALIDEESVLGSGSDGSLLNKLKSVHGQNEYYRGKSVYWVAF